jgi:NAD(P)-dependent dehydrogenase (short-subunit alcohol dehydrogenase family)
VAASSVAVVTGATRGIGREVAAQLAEAGSTVLVTGRRQAAAEAVAAELAPRGDVRAMPFALDITDARDVGHAVSFVESTIGRLDVLVNNAAAFVDWGERASTADLAGARQVLETNLFGSWQVTQAFLPLLRVGPHPRIVFVSSGAGSHGDERFGLDRRGGAAASYGISKAALNALVSSLAAELAGTPILVNAACPGLTATYPGAAEMGARPVADGAASVLWAATLPDGGPTGGLFRDGAPLPW